MIICTLNTEIRDQISLKSTSQKGNQMLLKNDMTQYSNGFRWENGILTNIEQQQSDEQDKQDQLNEFFSEENNEQIYRNHGIN